ncbi:hypothetical protein C465_13595 [Halorubrum distributum JCM 9100]|uniref:Uncharacterized protein n=2 Tax=Halorubrum distributum TaxID=29283 RepID=M0EFC3_9EURY|nr:hypothetical protein [Halorubrum distributum]ELZ45778.1 hypothetical protein C465_13595 [Halorubrum distributum JCM 9100]ELZ53533.1 hypothetical protein C466_07520 [Halorubrum distributum JCM 10118]PHQ47779.1 hypothetical protein DJ68_00045 [Halorubrum sp. C3]
MDFEEHPLADDDDTWNTVIEECRATAEEYRDRGWTVFAPVPGDVVPVPAPGDSADAKVGLDVLLSGAEFERLVELVEMDEFDEFEAFRAHENGIVYLTLVFRATTTQTVFCLPLYYRVTEADRMLDRVRAGDAMTTYCHALSGDERIEFDHDDPTPLFPPQDTGDA